MYVFYRCVSEKQKSFALGIQWILVRCLGKCQLMEELLANWMKMYYQYK